MLRLGSLLTRRGIADVDAIVRRRAAPGLVMSYDILFGWSPSISQHLNTNSLQSFLFHFTCTVRLVVCFLGYLSFDCSPWNPLKKTYLTANVNSIQNLQSSSITLQSSNLIILGREVAPILDAFQNAPERLALVKGLGVFTGEALRSLGIRTVGQDLRRMVESCDASNGTLGSL